MTAATSAGEHAVGAPAVGVTDADQSPARAEPVGTAGGWRRIRRRGTGAWRVAAPQGTGGVGGDVAHRRARPRRHRGASSWVAVLAILGGGSTIAAPVAAHPVAPPMREYVVPSGPVSPLGITLGPDGAMWFAGYAAGTVGRIGRNGEITEYPLPDPRGLPDVIVTGPDGNLWLTEVLGNRITRVTPEGVVTGFEVPTPGARPTVVTVGPDGALWFTQRGRPYPAGADDVPRIGRLTTDGRFTEFELLSRGGRPLGIATGPDGNLWVTLSMVDRIARVTPSGVVTEFDLPEACSPRCQPWEIAAGPDGAVWFTQILGNRVGRITMTGEITSVDLPRADSGPNGITVGPGGHVYVALFGRVPGAGNSVAVVTMDGRVVEWPLPGVDRGPIGIAPGRGQDLWVTQSGTTAAPGDTLVKVLGAAGHARAALRAP
jgi:streptogramin lyase